MAICRWPCRLPLVASTAAYDVEGCHQRHAETGKPSREALSWTSGAVRARSHRRCRGLEDANCWMTSSRMASARSARLRSHRQARRSVFRRTSRLRVQQALGLHGPSGHGAPHVAAVSCGASPKSRMQWGSSCIKNRTAGRWVHLVTVEEKWTETFDELCMDKFRLACHSDAAKS